MIRKKIKKYSFIYLGIALVVLTLAVLVLQKSLVNHPCANTLSCAESLQLSINNDEKALFNGKEFDPPKIDLSLISGEPKVLGTVTPSSGKRIYVDLTTQTLKAYDGDVLFMEAKVSTGKWFPTPTGDYTIWSKIRSAKMSGGEGATYYYLPNVPYIMFFSNSEIAPSRGFALHGAYWHNNFGHPMSHGCVNMRIIDAQKLYYWASPFTAENQSARADDGTGTLITIYGETP